MNAATPRNRLHVIQGQYHISDKPDVVLSTILGSCVAACLRDPVAGVGGMNHFLLPGSAGEGTGEATRYGVHLMELLINALLQQGASKSRLEAKVFGGAQTMSRLSDVGRKNGAFAEQFLRDEGIKIVNSSLGGELGRKVEFWPVSGRARQSILNGSETMKAVAREQPVAPKPAPADDIEFF
ncbi:chemotaxis protein CheD [Hoeflea sp. TYP-13]|uniref:chemotaxis protein CheD n=1 Tax=Hoeflea sp. TYP-13 TaxID=3230023 RepID=UPI0034C5C5BB